MMQDKCNRVDLHWHIIRTQPHQEMKLRDLLVAHMHENGNILEVYCPTHTTVHLTDNSRQKRAPLFAGHVFALATHEALTAFVREHYPGGTVLYARRKEADGKSVAWTVPEEQMRLFRDFNENYADQVVVLEKPYSDYAFNPKTQEPNEVVKVIDGPLAGCVGYLVRFNRNRGLVFNIMGSGSASSLTVAVPDVWNFHVVRLHNAANDRLSLATKKDRGADVLVGAAQRCGYGLLTSSMVHAVVEQLKQKTSISHLTSRLLQDGHRKLARCVADFTSAEVADVLYLVRYLQECPDYMDRWRFIVMRPFLTPARQASAACDKWSLLEHPDFTEMVQRVEFDEPTYQPETEQEVCANVAYDMHLGVMREGEGCVVFCDWDSFLQEYFLTGDMARRKLLNSFSTHAPMLYRVLNGLSAVEVLNPGLTFFRPEAENMPDQTSGGVGHKLVPVTRRVLAVRVKDAYLPSDPQVVEAADELGNTALLICREINTSAHLALWRRLLRTVWLHE